MDFRKAFVFKPVRNQLSMLVCCNLSFIRPLNASYLEMDG